MGNDDVMKKLVWVKDGMMDVLAVKSDADNTPVEPAVLGAVFRISESNLWMSPDAQYKGPNKATKSFADIKLNCAGVRPDLLDGPFYDEYAEVIKRIRELEDLKITDGSERQGIVQRSSGSDSVRFRHMVFEVC